MFYHSDSGGYPITRASRGLLVLWSLFLLGGFALAFWLDPDPRGFGTHQKLGLPPCMFRVLFNVPCPACGMTTSFAHFARGNMQQAVASNAAAVVLAMFCIVQIPWCWCSAVQGRLYGISKPEAGLLWSMCLLGGICIVNWVVQLCVA